MEIFNKNISYFIFQKENEIRQENSIFWLSLARNTCTAQVITFDVRHSYFTKKKLK